MTCHNPQYAKDTLIYSGTESDPACCLKNTSTSAVIHQPAFPHTREPQAINSVQTATGPCLGSIRRPPLNWRLDLTDRDLVSHLANEFERRYKKGMLLFYRILR